MIVWTVAAGETAAEPTFTVEEFGEDPGAGFRIGVPILAALNGFVMRPLSFIQDGHFITLESNASPRRRYSFRAVSPPPPREVPRVSATGLRVATTF